MSLEQMELNDEVDTDEEMLASLIMRDYGIRHLGQLCGALLDVAAFYNELPASCVRDLDAMERRYRDDVEEACELFGLSAKEAYHELLERVDVAWLLRSGVLQILEEVI